LRLLVTIYCGIKIRKLTLIRVIIGGMVSQVCRHDIEGGLGQPGEGGCIYLEICTVSSVL
jgi:hypothetical protein